MKFTNKRVVAAAAAIALGLGVVALSGPANAAEVGHWTPEGTPEPFRLVWMMDGLPVPENTVLKYEDDVLAVPNFDDIEERFGEAPAEADGAVVFISKPGEERSIDGWLSKIDIGFSAGSKRILQAPAYLYRFPAHTFGAIKAAGGEYSMGLGYTKNNGVTFVGIGGYSRIKITAGTADWTFEQPVWVPGTTTPPPSSGQIGVEAPVVAPEPPVDGPLELSIPADAKATLSGAKLVDGKSTATGLLPVFDVTDERVVSKKGWDATASVTEFVRKDGTEKIGADALTIAPKVVADGTTSTGVAAQAGFQGSATAKPFATAAAGTGVGTTKLSADLTFVAPAGSVEGTYTSKVTVTVVSK